MKLRINQKTIPLLATFAVFILVYAFGGLSYRRFFSLRVFVNLFTDNAFLGIAAIGMTFVILSGGIDLSVGSVISTTAMIIASLVEHGHVSPIIVVPLALALGALFGCAMGCLIHFFDAPPFIVTLAGMFFARGLGFIISLDAIPIQHPFFYRASEIGIPLTGIISLPLTAIIFIVVFFAGIFLAHYTKFGRNVYAIGGNEQSALLMGLPVGKTKILIYTLSGFCSALGGVVYTFYTLSGYGLAAMGLELDAIASVVIGGTLLTGGVGFVAGTLIGVLIQGLIQTIIAFQGTLNVYWTKIVIGLLLFTFIILQKIFSARASKAQAISAS